MAKTVLIVTGNYTKSYPIIESLKRAGYNTIVGVNDQPHPIITEAFSKFTDKIEYIKHPMISEEAYIQSIIQIIKKNLIDIIIPVGFIDFLTISKYKAIIEKYCIVPTESYDKICTVSDKWRAKELAESSGIYFPRSILLKSVEKEIIHDFIKKVGLPIIVKGQGDDSKPLFITDVHHLLKVLEMRVKEGKTLLQEFIPGIGLGYFALSFKGKPIAEFAHKRIFEAKPLGGASVKACTHLNPEVLDLGRNVISKIKWTGLIMVELKKEAETGDFYLMELNPKFWGSLELAFKAGVDFPRYLVDFFLHGKIPEKILVRNITFSWLESAISSYSKYDLKTTVEVSLRTINKNLLMTDFHIHDLPNFSIKALVSAYYILRSAANKPFLSNIYLTEQMKKALYEVKLVIADLDGTLLHLRVPWHKVLKQAFSLGLVKKGEGLAEAFCKYWSKRDMKNFEKLNKIVEEVEVEAARKITKDKKLLDAVHGLLSKGVKIAIVSKQSRTSIEEALKNLGLANYVHTLIGREDNPFRAKQIQRAILEVFESKLMRSTETIMLGDTLSDIKAAFKANTTPCRVASTNIEKIQSVELGVSYSSNVLYLIKLLLLKKNSLKKNF